jgi:hypothetical protein
MSSFNSDWHYRGHPSILVALQQSLLKMISFIGSMFIKIWSSERVSWKFRRKSVLSIQNLKIFIISKINIENGMCFLSGGFVHSAGLTGPFRSWLQFYVKNLCTINLLFAQGAAVISSWDNISSSSHCCWVLSPRWWRIKNGDSALSREIHFNSPHMAFPGPIESLSLRGGCHEGMRFCQDVGQGISVDYRSITQILWYSIETRQEMAVFGAIIPGASRFWMKLIIVADRRAMSDQKMDYLMNLSWSFVSFQYPQRQPMENEGLSVKVTTSCKLPTFSAGRDSQVTDPGDGMMSSRPTKRYWIT